MSSLKIFSRSKDSDSLGNVVVEEKDSASVQSVVVPSEPHHNTHTFRRLKPRHIQLIGMGGTIGTALFIQLGGTLMKGGPANLFMAFSIWCIPIMMLTVCAAEMVTLYPLPSPFVRLAGRCVDESLEVAAGYTFFFLQAVLVPFEITAVTVIVHYWRDDFTPAAVIVPQIGLYVLINLIVPVNYYGEVEFWMAILKVLLIIGLILFVFVTMVGGNPQHDAYGFRYWNNPGAFKEYIAEGSLGRFLGFFSALSMASYVIAGPDYVSMTAGEAINPRKTLPSAYKGVVFRLTIFFSIGTLAMGIVVPYNDPNMMKAWAEGGSDNASGSPYVAGMIRMGIPILPHIVNVGVLSSAFSAGNSYFYCATRTLYGMAVDGHAPKFFTWCTPNGVPYMSALVVVAFAMLSFLQMSQSANTVLGYIIGLGTVCELIIYSIISFTFIRFYKACKAQGIDRRTFPFRGWCQPYLAYITFCACSFMTFFAGYGVFLKGNWSVGTFITNYIMIPVALIIFVFWKFYKKTKFLSPEEVDLKSGLEEVTEHEKHVVYHPPKNWFEKILRIVLGDA